MFEIINGPIFGITITLFFYVISQYIFQKFKYSLLNPIFLTTLFIIIFLKMTNISYEAYNKGGYIFTALITPATIALAIPLYRNFHLLKKHYISIISGIVIGNTINCLLIAYICKFLEYEYNISASFMPKSVTTAIAIDVSKNLEAIVPITILLVVITGITGAVIGPIIYNFMQIKDNVAIGVSLGSSSHAVGTSKAVEISEEAGAISALSIGLTGIYVIIIAPIIVKWILL